MKRRNLWARVAALETSTPAARSPGPTLTDAERIIRLGALERAAAGGDLEAARLWATAKSILDRARG
jgi:hypothetical protein